MKLSSREKTLLYVAALLLIVTGGVYLLINPTSAKLTAAQNRLALLEEQEMERRTVIAAAPQYQEEGDKLSDRLDALSADFYDPMVTEQADTLMQRYLAQYRLSCDDQTLTALAAAETPAYRQTPEGEEGSLPKIYVTTTTLSGAGTIADAMAFADAFAKLESARIVYAELSADDENPALCNYAFQIEIYMN